MKKYVFCLLLTVLLLFLAKPFYSQNIILSDFEISSPLEVEIQIFYGQKDQPAPAEPQISLSVKGKDQKIAFQWPLNDISAIGFKFITRAPSVFLSPLNVRGTTERSFSFSSGTVSDKPELILPAEQNVFAFEDFSWLQPRSVFSFSVFGLILGMSAVFSYCFFSFPLVRLVAAAVAGFAGFAFAYEIEPSFLNVFLSLFVFAFFLVFYYRTYFPQSPPINGTLGFFGFLFGVINVLSLSMETTDSWRLVTDRPFFAATAVFGQGVLFYTLGLYFFRLLSSDAFFKPQNIAQRAAAFLDFYKNHTVFCVFLMIMICWLPWHFIYYPGIVSWDSKGQIKQALGLLNQSQRHPFVSTYLIGGLFQIGRWIKDDYLGIYLYTLLQSGICAFVFALCLNRMKELGVNLYFQAVCLCFFALVPIGGFISVWGTKDILYGGVLTLFVLQSLSAFYCPEKYFSKQSQFIAYAAVFLIACILRKNGFYVVLPTVAAVLLFSTISGKIKKQAAIYTGLGIIVFLGLTKSVFPALGFPEGSKKEAFSIPFQQTARYLKYHSQDVTAQEKQVINRILKVEEIASAYAPKISDPVKATYEPHGRLRENEYLRTYLMTAAKMFFKHPVTAIQATMANSFGYYAFTPYFLVRQAEPFDNVLTVTFPKRFENVRRFILDLRDESLISALLLPLFQAAPYTWILVLIGIYFWTTKQKKQLVLLLPSFLTLLICIASPVNGLLRYYLPVMMSMPVVFAFSAAQAFRYKQTKGSL